jgi:N-acetylglucosaminyldiphosphoundecaprenol N-acetyl-beta-D-mannosaminyltransferase
MRKYANLGVVDLSRRAFTGIPVVAASKNEVSEAIVAKALDGSSKGCDVHLLEANGLSVAETNPDFERLLMGAGMVIPDGRWLELLTGRSNQPLTQFRGEDLFRTLLAEGRKQKIRHFFVGATEEKLQKLFRVLEQQYPGVTVAGHWVPPFRDLTPAEQDELDHLVTNSRAHIVWLGISTPRQDWEAARVARQTKKVAIAVGAAFEFVSGDKKTAPRWASRLGVEWLYRMLSEPRRLARRYVVGTFLFARRVFRYRREDVLAP